MKQEYTVSGKIDSKFLLGPDLPDPIVGVAYDQTLSLIDGTPPYVLTPIKVPDGMAMELTQAGVHFHGTPTAADASWSFKIEDSGK